MRHLKPTATLYIVNIRWYAFSNISYIYHLQTWNLRWCYERHIFCTFSLSNSAGETCVLFKKIKKKSKLKHIIRLLKAFWRFKSTLHARSQRIEMWPWCQTRDKRRKVFIFEIRKESKFYKYGTCLNNQVSQHFCHNTYRTHITRNFLPLLLPEKWMIFIFPGNKLVTLTERLVRYFLPYWLLQCWTDL